MLNKIKNKNRIRRIDDNLNFITTDSGNFQILNDKELMQFNSLKVNDELESKLLSKNILLNEKNMNNEIIKLSKKYSFLHQGTSLHIIVTTLRCNMKCIYCHASSRCENETNFDMDKKTAKKTVDLIFQSPSENITIELQGGEPTLNWDICKFIINYANEVNKKYLKNVEFSIVSNFTTMNEEIMEFLINNKIGICTSLDGPEELHNKNRIYTKNNNYKQVIDWIKKINKEYEKRNIHKKVYALPTITKFSLDYYKEIVDLYRELKIESIHIRPLSNLGFASNKWNNIYYNTEYFLEFWEKINNYILELKKDGEEITDRITEIMIKKITEDFDPNYLELRSPCGAVIGQLLYNYDGKVYSCDEARMLGEDLFKLGTVNNTYSEITTSKKACNIVMSSSNDNYIVCDNCAYKPYCGVCPVCNYAEQGNVIANIEKTERCKINKFQFDWVVKNIIKK